MVKSKIKYKLLIIKNYTLKLNWQCITRFKHWKSLSNRIQKSANLVSNILLRPQMLSQPSKNWIELKKTYRIQKIR
ncbi:hypothetical protein SAMN05444412_11521 [Rhodonellum ikkaensis]|uniref:Uncharacterized protein n=1 Tax=Rhodonellum ikkaensis TaxID=336829 RepID=A0A1H3T349_9BACT|nr:hypothetical protein SAMN05444412_11521 [Rhodonellum ikkaensis]